MKKKTKDMIIELVAGGAGGMAGLAVGYPADTIKVHQQVNGISISQAFKFILKNYGIRGFFRGMTVPMITNGLVFAVFFTSYTKCLDYLTAKDGRLEQSHIQHRTIEDVSTYNEIFVAGCVGGFCQGLAASPVEFLKVRLQMYKEKKTPRVLNLIREVIAKRGYRGLGIGLVPTLGRDIHSHGLYAVTYKYYLNNFCATDPGIFCVFMGGGIAGCLFWWSCIPMDVIKSKMQADSLSNPQYKGTVDCTRKLYRNGGIKPFLRGYGTVVIRAFPANGAVFVVHHGLRSLFETWGF